MSCSFFSSRLFVGLFAVGKDESSYSLREYIYLNENLLGILLNWTVAHNISLHALYINPKHNLCFRLPSLLKKYKESAGNLYRTN